MKIGLGRDFRVDHLFPEKKFLSKFEIIEWFKEYDTTENIQYKDVDLDGIAWNRCYSSTLLRSVNTSSHIYRENLASHKNIYVSWVIRIR